MSVGHLKAIALTNLDATPSLRATAGKGASGSLKNISAYAAAHVTAAFDADSTLALVRIPFDAIVKHIHYGSASQGTAGKYDLGVYYASDGSNALSKAVLLAADAIDQDFFIAALDLGGGASSIDVYPGDGIGYDGVATAIVKSAPAWARNDINKPLWDAVGLSANPGGYADIVATCTEAPGTGGGDIVLSVDYVLA